jgi:acetylornithine aminotransferase
MEAYDQTLAAAMDADEKYVMRTYGRLPVEFVSGSGAELVDSAGRTYVDCLAGIGAVSLGHCHPDVARALSRQVGMLWQVGNYFYVQNRGELAQDLSHLLSSTCDGHGHVTGTTGTTWRTFFANSGAEANEGAIKLARRWGATHLGGASTIVTARQSFHGRTLATLAATGQESFHQDFQPLPAGFVDVPLNDATVLADLLDVMPKGVGAACAVMLECVQGEGGVWPATPEYLQAVARECTERGLLLMVDEVQTGFFRCGAPFCYQLAGIEPDVVSMAKGIADGFPMGAVAARTQVADLMGPGDHGSTFGGNALAAAAGRATVEAMQNEHIGEHVIACGARFREQLASLPHVREVRGHGLMLGAELDVPVAGRLVKEGLRRGVVLNHIGDRILRFLPPLVITHGQLDYVAGVLLDTLS